MSESVSNSGSRLRPPKGVGLRYWLRAKAVPVAAKVGRRLGIPWTRLGDMLGREVLIAQVDSLSPVHTGKRVNKRLDIVFASMIGGYAHYLSMEYVLAMALAARGHRVRFILCDQMFPLCDIRRAGKEEQWSRLCGKCYTFGKELLSNSGFDVIPVSSVAETDAHYRNSWDEIVDTSLLRHLRVGVIETEDHEVSRHRKLLERTAAISGAVGDFLIDEAPDRVILTHGIYAVWGTLRSVLNEAGIPVVTFQDAKKKDSWIFSWTHETARWDVSEEWERVRTIPLNDGQEKQLDRYLGSRRDHSEDILQYNFGAEEQAEKLKRRLGLDPSKKTYVLFTNVLWDAASTFRDVVFSDPIEWVVETIKWFGSRPERQLVVKIHPAEIVIGTNQPFKQIIEKYVREVPSNVFIVYPEEPINSWSVISIADVGVVHTSTVGLELALEGIPAVVVSKTHYRDKGFTVDVSSRKQYFDVLFSDPADLVDTDDVQRLARRYSYLLFERYQLLIPYIYSTGYSDTRALTFDDSRALAESPTIQKLVRSIETHGDFFAPSVNDTAQVMS